MESIVLRYLGKKDPKLKDPILVEGLPGVGNVGKLTLGVLTRSEYARHAVLCALIAFLHPDLYRVAV